MPATTHHNFTDRLASSYPDIQVRRGLRFVESSPRIATAGGLSSGIDLALRVVERYYGRDVAARTAAYMEYQGEGWKSA
jgi:transcriptional regulator GlxA family with amidase domain